MDSRFKILIMEFQTQGPYKTLLHYVSFYCIHPNGLLKGTRTFDNNFDIYSRVPNKRGGGVRIIWGGWKWLDMTIIGGGWNDWRVLGEMENSPFLR